MSSEFQAEWFFLKKFPRLIFDRSEMVQAARNRLKYKASLHPILFELLPEKFTIPQLQSLFEDVYQASFDKRNFNRKIISTGLLLKQKEKDRSNSKKGAFFFKLDKKTYRDNFLSILRMIPNPNHSV